MSESDEEQGRKTVIAEEDDSDIDSDEAFGESDEEKYEGYAFASDRRRKDSRGNGSDNDGESDEEEEEGMVDLSTMLDGKGFSSDEEGSLEEDASEEDDSEPDLEGREGVSGKLGHLVSSYAQPQAKRSANDEEDGGEDNATANKRRRRLLAEQIESMPESEYAAPHTGAVGSVGLDDLLAPLTGTTAGDLASLRNNTKALRAVEQSKRKGNAADQPVASRRGGGTLSAPLPDVVKDRLQRAAGYELSKEEAEKWQSTIKRLREAEHLSFPLQAGPSQPKASTAQLTANFKPSNALEADINKLLEAEGLSEKQIAQSEELAMRKMDPQEAQRRKEELRKMRELMFRAEQKAKRVNKIKSKTYRKIARKDKERQQEKLRAAGLLDEEDMDDAEDDQERTAMERNRAKERATLKHKNTGKWAQAMRGRKGDAEDMDEARRAIDEQLSRSEQLRRRIEGRRDGSSDEDSYKDSAEDSDEDPQAAAFDELRALDDREAEQQAEAPQGSKKGVWNMKFMQDARNRDTAAADQVRQDFEADLRRMRKEEDASGSDEDDEGEGMEQQAVIGRRMFTAPEQSRQNAASRSQVTTHTPHDVDVGLSDDESAPSPEASERLPAVPATRSLSKSALSKPLNDEISGDNPWLAATTRTDKPKALATASSSAATKSASKLAKRKNKAEEVRAEVEDDAQLEIDPSAMLSVKSNAAPTAAKPVAQTSQAPQKHAAQRKASKAEISDSDSEADDEELIELQAPGRRANKHAFSQRDLIAEAFAGDDVAADFAAEKARIASEDAPKEVDNTLPGWGSWGGKGVKTNKKSGAAKRREAELKAKHTTHIPGLDAAKRKDAGMSNVIINERKDKKAEKYKVKELPYPYTSAQQYNAQRQQPLGPEWNTLTQKQRLTMPRVLATKPGAVIKPVQRL